MPQTRNGHALTEQQKRRYDSLSDSQKSKVDRNIRNYDSRNGGASYGVRATNDRNTFINSVLSPVNSRQTSVSRTRRATQGNMVGRRKAIEALGAKTYNALPVEQRRRMNDLASVSTSQNVRVQANNWLRRNTRSTKNKGNNSTTHKGIAVVKIPYETLNALTDNQYYLLNRAKKNGTSPQNIINMAQQMAKQNAKDKAKYKSSVPTRTNTVNTTATRTSSGTTPVTQPQTFTGATNNTTVPTRTNTVDNSVQNNSVVKQPISRKVANTPAKSNKPTSHTIQQGETLSGIAKRYGVDWRQLAKDNGIDDPNMIIAGRKLNINGSTKQPRKKAKRDLSNTPPSAERVLRAPGNRFSVLPTETPNVAIPNVNAGFRRPEDILGAF